MRKMMLVLALALTTVAGLSGCYTAGRATGEAADSVERGADRFESGYETGRDR